MRKLRPSARRKEEKVSSRVTPLRTILLLLLLLLLASGCSSGTGPTVEPCLREASDAPCADDATHPECWLCPLAEKWQPEAVGGRTCVGVVINEDARTIRVCCSR